MNAIDKPPKQFTEGPWERESLGAEWTTEKIDNSQELFDNMYGEGNWQFDSTTGRILISPDHNSPIAVLAKNAGNYLHHSNNEEQKEANQGGLEMLLGQRLGATMEQFGVWTSARRDSVRLKSGNETLGIDPIMADVAITQKHVDRGNPERSRAMKALDHTFNDVGLFALEHPKQADKNYFDAQMITVSEDDRILQVGETIGSAEMHRRGEKRQLELESLGVNDFARYNLPVRIKREKKDGGLPDYDTESLIFDPYHQRYLLAKRTLTTA